MAPTSRSRRPKVLTSKSAKQYLTVGFAVGIVVLLLLQMTALSRHSIPEHSSPLNLALREQRHHDVSQKNTVQQERTLQRYAESKKKSDRRRLNTTHGNQSRAENASTATVLKEDLPKLPSTGHALQFLNTTFKLQKRNQTHPADLTKTLGNVTNLIARRQRNATTLQRSSIPTNVTANATAVPTKKHRPFRLQRSVPQAPWEFQNRSMPLDPLSPKFDISTLRPTNYTLKSKWHGVLLDAGRHYFEVDWIMRMLDILAVLQYNCLHFRLTDDQSFNVLLKSQPDLAHPVGLFGNNKTYTPDELKNIVAYAKTKGITVWPEINVPGHGGGWAGIPGLIVQCPEFICEKGYGVPINVTHPKFRDVLTDVLREILDIFDNPPYLHLGGDEVDMAQPCFDEFGEPMFDYDDFERTLKLILDDINYPEEQVIRWEMTGQRLNSMRTGKMPQYWFRIPGESGPNLGRNNFFASGGLYFDFNEMDMAWKIYLFTRRYYHLPGDNFPVGIIVGTFELDAQFWYDRNVVGRLLAVTMGASNEVNADDGNELYDLYGKACAQVGFDDALCSHYGLPFLSWKEYKEKWTDVWTMWKGRICDRLTLPKIEMTFVGPYEQPNGHRRYGFTPHGKSPQDFWEKFGMTTNKTLLDLDSDEKFSALKPWANLTVLMNRLVSKAGIVIDLTIAHDVEEVTSLLRQTHALGFNLIQLRLLSDYAIGFRSETLAHAPPRDQLNRMSIDDMKSSLVADATRFSIGIMPEISLTTNTAGLYDVGFNVPCATFTCQKGLGVQDINKPLYAPLAYGLIREVETIATSGMMHIGSDERVSGAECFEEALDETPDFASFEQKLKYLLEFDGITNSQIVRWSNEENIEYPDRLGTITQCREGDCRTGNTGSWIATFDLQKGGPYEIYNSARELVLRNPMAIVAEVGNILRDESEHYNIPKRMLAYAMGISDIKEWSQGMFEETFIPLCTELFGPTAGCSEFSKSHEGIEGASALPIANQERLCQERTRNTTRHVYRPEFQEIVTSVEVHSFDQAGL